LIPWLERCRRAAASDPTRFRLPLFFAAGGALSRIGSVEANTAERLRSAGLLLADGSTGYRVIGDGDAALARIACWLREEGLTAPWRDEALDVASDDGHVVGTIERAAVRVLGIRTRAVHLVGVRAGNGGIWVQQRAFDKATDPGQWDTLMGGQVGAGESIAATLRRETLEEAGLELDALGAILRAPSLTIRRPVAEGYMIEDIEVFRALVPAGLDPVNRDGEVERFECLGQTELVARLAAGAFTLEAALILGAELERHRDRGEI